MPAPLPAITQSDAKNILVQWFESKALTRFRRQEALAVVHAAGPFASDARQVDSATDNALKLLKTEGELLNLPAQQGTWMVVSRLLQLQEVA